MDPPVHTGSFHSGATAMIFIVTGAKSVSSFVMCSPVPWKMAVPRVNTTLAYHPLWMSTSQFFGDLERSVVDPAGSFTSEIWLEHYFCAVETFSADSDDVPVWENVGLSLCTCTVDLCSVS